MKDKDEGARQEEPLNETVIEVDQREEASHHHHLLNASEDSVFCRICHRRSPSSDLVTPCKCQGTISFIHKKCLENWLTQSKTSHCELCGTKLRCVKQPASFTSWIGKSPKALCTDIALFMFTAPLAVLCVFLCFRGAVLQAQMDFLAQSLCLFALGSFLVGVFLAWMTLSVRNHFVTFREFQRKHHVVRVIVQDCHRAKNRTSDL